MALILTIIASLYGVVMPAQTQVEGWRGLIPLHATRSDVEHLLGAPTKSHGVASTYDTKNERVHIFYSGGPCKKGVSEEWNVPANTILSLTVHPNAKLLVDSLKLDKGKYRREGDPHADLVVYYVNRQEGIRISARMLADGEAVDSITYEPAAKDNYLKCSNSSAQRADRNQREYFINKFDQYSDLSSEDEKAHLDNFASYLQKNEPQFKGYIVVYAGREARSGEAQARAKRAKTYLVKVRGIEAARITIVDGGQRDRSEVELYSLPAAMSPPTPNPYRRD